MKIKIVTFFLITVMAAEPLYASKMPTEITIKPNQASVCFIDFRIDFPVGKSETDIKQSRYCRYAIDKKMFLGMLSPRPDSEFYMDSNVRAVVLFSRCSVYYIDYNGIVRSGQKKFSINKMVFTNALKKLPQPSDEAHYPPQEQQHCMSKNQ